jgi:His-Xaa-Ser system radical SAM maturase HxsC
MGEPMSVALHAKAEFRNFGDQSPRVVRLRAADWQGEVGPDDAVLLQNRDVPDQAGYTLALLRDGGLFDADSDKAEIKLPPSLSYLVPGDVIRLNPRESAVNVLYRSGSRHNTILVTEQCDNYCLMCSQPPKRMDDAWFIDDAFKVVSLLPTDTTDLGFSGGEPTLHGQRFVDLLRHVRDTLPTCAVDVLSNGRRFSDDAFARAYGAVLHPDLVTGIPLYSDDPARHDYVVQAIGAFDQTVRGIINLKRAGGRIQLRIVLHQQTIDRLVSTCRFIARNLLFVDQVALMGLEMMGFARANLDRLWVDPHSYRDTLSEAVALLNAYRIPCRVFNHPLCTVNPDVEMNYARSISDWKNEYLPACEPCTRKEECGGFFASGVKFRHSDHIRPFC